MFSSSLASMYKDVSMWVENRLCIITKCIVITLIFSKLTIYLLFTFSFHFGFVYNISCSYVIRFLCSVCEKISF